ncbi:hypothetical protein KQUDLBSD_CDS0064 [Staphylococcus phage PG-2021_40]
MKKHQSSSLKRTVKLSDKLTPENVKKNNSIGAVKAQESWFRLSVNQPNPGDIEVIKNFIQK